jgi:hypothetical protein
VSVLGRYLGREVARSKRLSESATGLCALAEAACTRRSGRVKRTASEPSRVTQEPPLAAPRPANPPPPPRRARRREAHFPIGTLTIGGELWSVAHGTLDVYQPADRDPTDAQWEVLFAPTTRDAAALRLNGEYELEIETRDGRFFKGRAFLQHNAGPVWTLLDTGAPLDGLWPEDLV